VLRPKTIIVLVILVASVAGFVLVASGQLPYRMYAVRTASMTPTFPVRSAILVRQGDYRPGQPITFRVQGGMVTHRLVGINDDGTVVTKGDANATVDPWRVPTTSIVGGVVASVPALGYWLVYFRSPFGLASLLLALAVCWQFWSFVAGRSAVLRESVQHRGDHAASRSNADDQAGSPATGMP